MQPLEPDQAAFLATLYLPALKNEHRLTRKVMEAIPSGQGGYRPDAVSMSALELAWHIASAEHMFLDAVASGRFTPPSPRPDHLATPEAVVQWYAATFQANFDRLTKLSPAELVKILDFRGAVQFPAIMYLQFAANHSIHHRGQLSVYLRPMGGEVPSIYGESYAAVQARKNAETQGASA
jgi:uncharacterized damage-inducible protein DinB